MNIKVTALTVSEKSINNKQKRVIANIESFPTCLNTGKPRTEFHANLNCKGFLFCTFNANTHILALNSSGEALRL